MDRPPMRIRNIELLLDAVASLQLGIEATENL